MTIRCCLIIVVAACSAETPEVVADSKGRPAKVIPVVVTQAEERRVEDAFLEREATLFPIAFAALSTRQEGFVLRRHVEEGDYVNKGDLIAELDPSDHVLRLAELHAALQRAQANLSEQKRATERSGELFRRNIVSQGAHDDQKTGLDRVRAEVKQAKARVDLAEKALTELRITAPMDAVVSKQSIEAGEYLERGDPVVELKRVDQVIAICTVSERYLADIHEGAPVDIMVTAHPGRTFNGLVWKIVPDAELESRGFPVRILLANPDFLLKPGMSARVAFTRSVDNALLVPKDAVRRDDDGAYVFIIKDQKAERRNIELGNSIDDRWLIRVGLNATDHIVVTGNEDLVGGEGVTIVELPPPGPPTLPQEFKADHGGAKGS